MTAGYLNAIGVRARHLVPRPIRRAASHALAAHRASDVQRSLDALAADARPIVIGPWLGEVGFELLYWVPFIRWFASAYSVPAERLIVVSRGGAATWYQSFAAHAVDALTLMSTEDYRRRNLERSGRLGEQKQLASSPFERDIVAAVRRTTEREFVKLHPSLMYRLFAPYWWGHEPIDWVRRFTDHATLAAPPRPDGLPQGYTAVKFYFNDCFTATPENRAFVSRTVRRLLDEGPVVSLATGAMLDEHTVEAPTDGRVHTIEDRLSPDTNLLVQSAVVAHARRFVGSYGGFAYLAPSYRVAAVTYYEHRDRFARSHLQLAHAVLTGGDPDRLRVEPAFAEASAGRPL